MRTFTYVHHALTTQPKAGLQDIRRWLLSPGRSDTLQETTVLKGLAYPEGLYPLRVCGRSLLAFVGSLLISLQQVFIVIGLDINGLCF